MIPYFSDALVNAQVSITIDGDLYPLQTITIDGTAASISSISPTSAHYFGGEEIVIQGLFLDHLQYDDVVCHFGWYMTSAHEISETNMTCEVPVIEAGDYDVWISINSRWMSNVLPAALNIFPKIHLESISRFAVTTSSSYQCKRELC